MPGARSRWIVTMKFTPVAIDEKPTRKIAAAASLTKLLE
jgi:hypothetical protein